MPWDLANIFLNLENYSFEPFVCNVSEIPHAHMRVVENLGKGSAFA